MKTIPIFVPVLMIIFITGCSRQNPSSTIRSQDNADTTEPAVDTGREGMAAQKAELQNIADCFFDAVHILQDEPATVSDLPRFLKRANDSQPTGGRGRFDLLRWDGAGERVILSSGHEVFVRISGQSRDHYNNGAEATFTTYEFYTKTPGPTAASTIEFWIGRPPE